jgi:hypothetical protein
MNKNIMHNIYLKGSLNDLVCLPKALICTLEELGKFIDHFPLFFLMYCTLHWMVRTHEALKNNVS